MAALPLLVALSSSCWEAPLAPAHGRLVLSDMQTGWVPETRRAAYKCVPSFRLKRAPAAVVEGGTV